MSSQKPISVSTGGSSIPRKKGIRNRVSRFSDSVLDILGSDSNDKMHSFPFRPATMAVSKTIVSLFLFSFALIILSTVFQLFTLLRPAGIKLSRRLGIKSKYIYASSGSYLSLQDYPALLVHESKPFSFSQHVNSNNDQREFTIVTPFSEDEVVRSVDYEPAEEVSARIIVLTMNRARSLGRLLNSLVAADYGDDVVDLDIWIDRPRGGEPIDEDVLSHARITTWKQGTKTIHKRLANAGLYQQWIYTWNITSQTTEFAVIFEDDLEASPAFYLWLRLARAAYGQDPDVAAFTLQRSTLRPLQRKGIATGSLNLSSAEHPVFKYRLLGTWGFAPQRDRWLEFRKWFELSRARDDKPYVDGLITTGWYKRQEVNGFAPHMWSQWWIKFVDEKNYFTVTPRLPDGTTLTANWRETGLHYNTKKPSVDFPVFRGSSDQFVMPDNPVHVDWDGLIIKDMKT